MIKSIKNILKYFKNLFDKTNLYNKPNELSKYSWNKVQSGIFQGKELFLPKTWGYKVKNLNHEREVFEVIKKVAPFSNVMYDIGAHYGWFSVAWVCYGGKLVEAFEPADQNADVMTETINKNNLHDSIKLHRHALGDKTKKEKLVLFPNDSSRNFIKTSVNQSSSSKDFQTINVQTFTLDDLIKKIKPPDLIKIDVEGFETKVLKGAKNTIIKFHPTIVAEIHDVSNALELADFLSGIGYEMRILGYKGKSKSLPHVLWQKK